MKTPLPSTNRRLLIVDDNPSIHADFRKILAGSRAEITAGALARPALFDEVPDASPHIDFAVDDAFQGAEGLAMVQHAIATDAPYAVAFVDIRMPPGWDGIETISRLWQDDPDLQVVICTAYADYSWEEMIRKLGRSDSLVVLKKPFDNIEVLQLAHALTEKWALNRRLKAQLHDLDELVACRTAELSSANEQLRGQIAERLEAERALRISEERFAKAFQANPIPMAIQSSRRDTFIDVNHGFELLTGLTRAELIARTPRDLELWADPTSQLSFEETLQRGTAVRNVPCQIRSQSGELRDTLVSVERLELGGEPSLLTIAQDITEQLKLERQLRHSQKMEAVGELAAGIAHDFNNMLTVIQGNTSLIIEDHTSESRDFALLQGVLSASQRSAKLVRQLLMFSRKQSLDVRPLEIHEILTAVSEMLPRTLGEHIRVIVTAAPDLPAINADAGMIEQMLMNLAINARDAMSGGGTLTIAATAIELTPAALRTNRDARPGNFLCISVTDTGTGISPEVLPRIFEPFYTTKPVGKGTGLGLATVYGIAKQHDGWIEVESEPGRGSTFNVFIPCTDEPAEILVPLEDESRDIGGTETILVVEDENTVRDFVIAVLKSRGYVTLSASNGVEALEVWSQNKQTIDLLLTDMIMPEGMTGAELANRLLEENPHLRVIYSSGYHPGIGATNTPFGRKENYLAKPYRSGALLRTIRSCLNQPHALVRTH